MAVGASRWRIVRQLLIESLLLAVIAGAVGYVLAVAGVRWFDGATQNVGNRTGSTFDMDVTVFAFMAAVCLGTALFLASRRAARLQNRRERNPQRGWTRGRPGSGRAVGPACSS